MNPYNYPGSYNYNHVRSNQVYEYGHGRREDRFQGQWGQPAAAAADFRREEMAQFGQRNDFRNRVVTDNNGRRIPSLFEAPYYTGQDRPPQYNRGAAFEPSYGRQTEVQRSEDDCIFDEYRGEIRQMLSSLFSGSRGRGGRGRRNNRKKRKNNVNSFVTNTPVTPVTNSCVTTVTMKKEPADTVPGVPGKVKVHSVTSDTKPATSGGNNEKDFKNMTAPALNKDSTVKMEFSGNKTVELSEQVNDSMDITDGDRDKVTNPDTESGTSSEHTNFLTASCSVVNENVNVKKPSLDSGLVSGCKDISPKELFIQADTNDTKSTTTEESANISEKSVHISHNVSEGSSSTTVTESVLSNVDKQSKSTKSVMADSSKIPVCNKEAGASYSTGGAVSEGCDPNMVSNTNNVDRVQRGLEAISLATEAALQREDSNTKSLEASPTMKHKHQLPSASLKIGPQARSGKQWSSSDYFVGESLPSSGQNLEEQSRDSSCHNKMYEDISDNSRLQADIYSSHESQTRSPYIGHQKFRSEHMVESRPRRDCGDGQFRVRSDATHRGNPSEPQVSFYGTNAGYESRRKDVPEALKRTVSEGSPRPLMGDYRGSHGAYHGGLSPSNSPRRHSHSPNRHGFSPHRFSSSPHKNSYSPHHHSNIPHRQTDIHVHNTYLSDQISHSQYYGAQQNPNSRRFNSHTEPQRAGHNSIGDTPHRPGYRPKHSGETPQKRKADETNEYEKISSENLDHEVTTSTKSVTGNKQDDSSTRKGSTENRQDKTGQGHHPGNHGHDSNQGQGQGHSFHANKTKMTLDVEHKDRTSLGQDSAKGDMYRNAKHSQDQRKRSHDGDQDQRKTNKDHEQDLRKSSQDSMKDLRRISHDSDKEQRRGSQTHERDQRKGNNDVEQNRHRDRKGSHATEDGPKDKEDRIRSSQERMKTAVKGRQSHDNSSRSKVNKDGPKQGQEGAKHDMESWLASTTPMANLYGKDPNQDSYGYSRSRNTSGESASRSRHTSGEGSRSRHSSMKEGGKGHNYSRSHSDGKSIDLVRQKSRNSQSQDRAAHMPGSKKEARGDHLFRAISQSDEEGGSDLDIDQDDSDDELETPFFLTSLTEASSRPIPSTPTKNVCGTHDSPVPGGSPQYSHMSSDPVTKSLFSLDSLLDETTNKTEKQVQYEEKHAELEAEIRKGGFVKITLEQEETKGLPEGLLPEHQVKLNHFQTSKSEMSEVHPGEQILTHARFQRLFTSTIRPSVCGVTQGPSRIENHLYNLQPDCFANLITSDIMLLCPLSSPILKWLLFIMSVDESHLVIQGCEKVIVEHLQTVRNTKSQSPSWSPSVSDLLSILCNYGAEVSDLLPNEVITTDQETIKLIEAREEHPQADRSRYNRENLRLVLSTLSIVLKTRPSYTKEQLNQFIIMLFRFALDKSLCNNFLTYEFQVVIASLLKLYSEEDWAVQSIELCKMLSLLTSHHHNRVHLCQLLPPTNRGSYLQKRVAYLHLQQLFFPEKNVSDTHLTNMLTNFKIKFLHSMLPVVQSLSNSDVYSLSSAISLLDLSVGNELIKSCDKEDLEYLTEQMKKISGDLRDHIQMLDRTKVKDMMIRVTSKWSLDLLSIGSKQKTLFAYTKQRSPPKMTIETVSASQSDPDQSSQSEEEDMIVEEESSSLANQNDSNKTFTLKQSTLSNVVIETRCKTENVKNTDQNEENDKKTENNKELCHKDKENLSNLQSSEEDLQMDFSDDDDLPEL